MKTIKVKVPKWFPTSTELREYKRKFKMWMFPPRCRDCNKRVKTSQFYWKLSRTGTHPLGHKNTVSDFAIRASRPSCATCMKKYLLQHPKDAGDCTICEETNVPVMGYTFSKEPKLFLTFLWHWWNGSKFCMKCIDDLLDNGHPATDIYSVKTVDGKSCSIPEYY